MPTSRASKKEGLRGAPKILFIAGGIGITPIRSLLEQMLRRGRDALLLYANRTERDIVFRGELEALSRRYTAPVINVLSEAPQYDGEVGQLTPERIGRLVPDVAQRDVYLCGPPPMMTALRVALVSLGVPTARIHYEKFSL